uniref:Uncharacterized protein n=1 Tax=Chromera velia CCMP2878 TaxID=1169474 RepID=A0A0G4FB13_9ALVE|eukprot:Cvel_15982.t1-p1 / transcript=Cvel_15982.t1 / gene=Cvel_15982 / organism=Chromera_velia_CCMP2878 / gene_product=hypothetical protein / transcript_product=hypothetical protein / location=Cvel_scaffold1210:27797-28828(-) / protein_length=344 / sequence_SO=supercontig / SO=protein_coding / is_pseudo=false
MSESTHIKSASIRPSRETESVVERVKAMYENRSRGSGSVSSTHQNPVTPPSRRRVPGSSRASLCLQSTPQHQASHCAGALATPNPLPSLCPARHAVAVALEECIQNGGRLGKVWGAEPMQFTLVAQIMNIANPTQEAEVPKYRITVRDCSAKSLVCVFNADSQIKNFGIMQLGPLMFVRIYGKLVSFGTRQPFFQAISVRPIKNDTEIPLHGIEVGHTYLKLTRPESMGGIGEAVGRQGGLDLTASAAEAVGRQGGLDLTGSAAEAVGGQSAVAVSAGSSGHVSETGDGGHAWLRHQAWLPSSTAIAVSATNTTANGGDSWGRANRCREPQRAPFSPPELTFHP